MNHSRKVMLITKKLVKNLLKMELLLTQYSAETMMKVYKQCGKRVLIFLMESI